MTTTFANYWARKLRRNPELAIARARLRLSTDQFRAELEQAFCAGIDHCSAVHRQLHELDRPTPAETLRFVGDLLATLDPPRATPPLRSLEPRVG